jgi:choline dehydrogenase
MLEGLLHSKALNRAYAGEPDPSLDGRALTWAAGRALGGSSSINGMVYGRGRPADYARWAAAGNPGWDGAGMLPWFRTTEDWGGAPHPARVAGGPLAVRRFDDPAPACRAVMDALVRRGVPYVEDYAVGTSEGVGLTQATQRRGWRHSTATACLRPARHRRNLTVMTPARALKVLVDRGRCRDVRIERRGRIRDVFAAHETILSAGAIATPTLLLLSGIGPAAVLEPHGIAVVDPIGGVGRHLNGHVNVRLSAFVDQPTYNSQRHGVAAPRHGAGFLATGTGPASSPANHVQAFVRSGPALASADTQLQVMAFGFGTRAETARDGITVVVSPCDPRARGSVSLRSADPLVAPRIAIELLAKADDRACLLRGCRLAEQGILDGPHGCLYAPASRPATDAEWLAFFRVNVGFNWHPTGTCRMGPGEDDVVDRTLVVRGWPG